MHRKAIWIITAVTALMFLCGGTFATAVDTVTVTKSSTLVSLEEDGHIREIIEGPKSGEYVYLTKNGVVASVKDGKTKILLRSGCKKLKYNKSSKTGTMWVSLNDGYSMSENVKIPSWLKIATEFKGHTVKVKGRYVYVNGVQTFKTDNQYPMLSILVSNKKQILGVRAKAAEILTKTIPFGVYISQEAVPTV